MPFHTCLSTLPQTEPAMEECLAQAKERFPGAVDLALLFFTPQHRDLALTLSKEIQRQLSPRCLLGCPGETVIADDREFEEGPALALWLARWSKDVAQTSFHLSPERTSEGFSLLGWPDELDETQTGQALLLTLADPFTFPVDYYLQRLNTDYRGLPVIGGMASGAHGPSENVLLIDGREVEQGAVAVLLRGDLGMRSVVSQGCRPIGKPMVITKAQENIITELGGHPPLAYLQQLWNELSPRDQKLAERGLHIGRVINEYQGTFQRGDFLIRNVMGLERDTGALAVTERVRPGQTVQFHLRDAVTADEDLGLMLDSAAAAGPSSAALLFSCNGRGTRLFDQPDHDAQLVRQRLGPIPLAGFFAQGELGPIGGQNFIHGFTASLALFTE